MLGRGEMAFFSNSDLAEISEMVKKKNEIKEKADLNTDVGDKLFADILYSLNDSINDEIKDKIAAGFEPIIPIWSTTEVTFYRQPGSKFDMRNNPRTDNPEVTLEDSLGSYVNEALGHSLRSYKISHVLKMSDVLPLLSHYFGSNFHVYMKRNRIITAATHHIYEVNLFLQYYPTNWPPAIAAKINKARVDYLARSIPCVYCMKSITNSESYQHTYCSAECHKKDHEGSF
jgi:hypothetical protein